MLILQQTADAFDKRLNFAFNWVLVLMTRSSGAHCDSVLGLEAISDCGGVLGGPCIASKETNAVSMTFVKGNHLFCCREEGVCGLVFDHDRMSIATEKVLVNEEAGVTPD
jgi:hypothetical protein